MPSTQKALLVTQINKPVVLTTDWPVPQPGPNQIQLKVNVAGINPHDQKARDWGLFIKNDLPAILTNDATGVVTSLGPNMAGIAVGDRVVFQPDFSSNYPQNGLQEFAIADAGAFARNPDHISDDEAATLPTNLIAPMIALFVELKIPAPWTPEAEHFDYADVTLLIVGGGSNCGRFGVQLAALVGVGRIVVVGGRESELKGLGATHVLDRHGGDEAVLARIRDVVGDELVYACDAVSPPAGQTLALNALSSTKRGTVARLVPTGPVDETKVLGKTAGYDLRDVHGVTFFHRELAAEFWGRLPRYLETRKIIPLEYVVKEGLEADHVNEVLDAYRDGKRVTKTHIHL